MRAKRSGLLYGLRAKDGLELIAAAASAVGCVALLVAGAFGDVSPWWCLVAVPVGVFNAVEVIGYVLVRQQEGADDGP
ncbi:hypothetical protein ABZT03_08355 [Streptomyces sp. NPDC005574]|uniref:hypothetical protein n=1 Tax=Streptomyces sp. NPDC005574 TaxID=3156891 RepID=UPI0033A12B5C